MIRRGTEIDLIKVGRLWIDMMKEENPESNPDLTAWRNLTSFLMRTGAYYLFLAEKGKEVVGFLDYILEKEPSLGKIMAFVRHFYVIPEYRKTMIPEILYNESLKCGIKNGTQILELSCLPDKVEFWGKRGFKTELIRMRKEIG